MSTRTCSVSLRGLCAALLAVLLAACGSVSRGDHAAEAPTRSIPTETAGDSARNGTTARAVCAGQFPGVVQAQMWTVGALRRVGPDPMPPRSLLPYRATTQAAVCLVRKRAGQYTAVAVMLPSGVSHPMWDQTEASAIVPPS
jgi:hypothetical protein